MRLGLHVGYWGLGLTAGQQLEIVGAAESAGFDSVWAAEAYGSDTATVLAWLAAHTERVRIGPNNTRLTGEIADGWLPTFFSPEHVGELRELLEEGAARAGGGKAIDASFDIAPMVNVAIDEDLDRARDALRPVLALYVGGMGSRRQNFYNALVRRYGFEQAADEVQDLYLDGRYDEAAAALPAELIDQTALCGPREHVAERLAVYRDAGVGTLICTPIAGDPVARVRMVRELAELV